MNFFAVKNRLILVPVALCVLYLFACSKHGDDTLPPVNPPVIPPDTMLVSLKPYYPGAVGDSTPYELIISTTDGSILIDTLLDKSKSASISYKTTNKLVDVTVINNNNFTHKYWATTYKAVNPSQWDTLVFGLSSRTFISSPYTNATMHYYNVPANNLGFVQFSSTSGSYAQGWLLGPTTMDVQYQQHPGVPVYVLFPIISLYKLYYPAKLADTVDLSVMDTTVRRKFSLDDIYWRNRISLTGFLDTSNYTKAIKVYEQGESDVHIYGVDIQYPLKYVQKYELRVAATNQISNDINDHYSYGDTVAYNFNLPDYKNYNLVATQKDNFSVQFVNTLPSYYMTDWEGDQVYFQVIASKDSTTLNPLNIINHLKTRSHFLSGDYSDLVIKRFLFEAVKNVDYPSYMGYSFNSNLRTGRIIYWSDQLTKIF